jgi:prepilin-type N-terminal cleavage/methylation domain-containing protein
MNAGRSAGFTLAEVLVALSILGTALFVLIGAHQSAMRLQIDAEGAVEERQLLESAVARAEVAVMTGSLGASGDFGTRYPGFGWAFDAQIAGSDVQSQLYQVTARLQTPDGEKKLEFFYYNTGATDEPTNKAGLSGKSSVHSGAPNSGLSGSNTSRSSGQGSSRGSSSSRSGSSRGSSSSSHSSFSSRSGSSSGGSFSSRGGGSSSRGGSMFQKDLSP